MSNYLLTLKKRGSSLFSTFARYDADGCLCGVEAQGYQPKPTPEQIRYMLYSIPLLEDELEKLKAPATQYSWTITPVEEDLTFDTVWDLYNHKSGSKKRARALWEKLNEETRALCLKQIRKYKYYCATSGTKKCHLDTWLRDERWESEYAK